MRNYLKNSGDAATMIREVESEPDAEIIYQDETLMVIRLTDYTACKNLASETSWCIREPYHWYDYVNNDTVQLMIVDFSRPIEDNKRMIGVTLNADRSDYFKTIGKIKNFYTRRKVIEMEFVRDMSLEVGEEVKIGGTYYKVKALRVNGKEVEKGEQSDTVSKCTFSVDLKDRYDRPRKDSLVEKKTGTKYFKFNTAHVRNDNFIAEEELEGILAKQGTDLNELFQLGSKTKIRNKNKSDSDYEEDSGY